MIIGIDASRANRVEKTGTEWYSFHIIRALVDQHPEVRFWLYTKEPLRPPLDRLTGARVENRVLRWRGILWSQLRLSLEMLLRPPEVLFVPAHTIPLIHPRATVTTCHDIGFERHPDLYGRRPIGSAHRLVQWFLNLLIRLVTLGRYGNSELDYHRWSMRLAVRQAAAIITVSAFTARELTAWYHISSAKITVIPHGFDQTEVYPPVPRLRLAENYGLTRPYLLYVGRLERKKNTEGLLAAYRQLLKDPVDRPDLVLVGQLSEGKGDILKLIRDLPAGRVRRLPWLTPPNLSAVMSQALAFVFPSLYEGFGLPVLTAFAHGVPVVCSKTSSLPEVADEAAVLVNPLDPAEIAKGIREVLDQPGLRARLIARGLERVRAFRWETAAEQTFRLLSEVNQRVVGRGHSMV